MSENKNPQKPTQKAPHAEASAPVDLHEQARVRLEKLKKLSEGGKSPYVNGFTPSHTGAELHRAYGEKTKEELEAEAIPCSVAGRIIAVRDFGKAAFVRLKDRSGLIQLFMEKATLGDAAHEEYKSLDLGDIIFAKGVVFKTKTGELSVKAKTFQLLTKALLPLPEKFHGLTDVETRYRQRYLDLIVNDKTRDTFIKRSKIIATIRSFFTDRDYIEVETPMMHPLVGGAAARPFKTHHNTLDMELFMRIAPELYLKRLVVGGMDRVFEINRNFRNEGISVQHNPEFTMIEFYQAYATFDDLMKLTQELFQKIADTVSGTRKITYQGTEINLDGEWKRISVEDSVLTMSGFKDKAKIRDPKALLEYGKKTGIEMNPKDPAGNLIMAIFEAEVESKLTQPTFVTYYPADISPLSRRNDKDPFLVDRFELFVCGREMGNAFSELNDPIDQKERFLAQVRSKKEGNPEACDMDEDYITALEHGLPPTAGEGIGIDRLVMLFTDSPSIRDVILFPLMRMTHHAAPPTKGH